MSDITLRAIATLKSADLILSEDTRRTGVLLKKYDITTKQNSFNDMNKEKKTPAILKLLQSQELALVSDAGTPSISDPGFYLVREAIKENIQIIPIPGPSAFLTALTASGLPTDRFTFYGFLPKKPGKKTDLLKNLPKKQTAILYESPHRIVKTLKLLAELKPKAEVVVARELTKKFEEFLRGNAEEVYKAASKRSLKGEFVLLIHP